MRVGVEQCECEGAAVARVVSQVSAKRVQSLLVLNSGIRDLGALESAVGQLRMTFGGAKLYPDLASKATAMA